MSDLATASDIQVTVSLYDIDKEAAVVFATQKLLKDALKEIKGIEAKDRQDIKVNVIGVNHFTWLTKAKYQNFDLFDVYTV